MNLVRFLDEGHKNFIKYFDNICRILRISRPSALRQFYLVPIDHLKSLNFSNIYDFTSFLIVKYLK